MNDRPTHVQRRVHKVLLAVAGIPAIAIGAILLVVPRVLHDPNGVDLGTNASLASEIRAPGGALMAVGMLLVTAVLVPRLIFAASVAGATLYLGYALGRFTSMALDGEPSTALVVAAIAELIFGVALTWALWASRARTPQ